MMEHCFGIDGKGLGMGGRKVGKSAKWKSPRLLELWGEAGKSRDAVSNYSQQSGTGGGGGIP